MTARAMYSIEEIKDMLIARMPDVAYHYAPPAPGSYHDKHLYFTLNPGRADRTVGSFCIHITGPKAGHWCDFASNPKGGDPFDLIGLSLNLRDMADQLREARAFLGLQTDSPEARRQREVALAAQRARRAEAEAEQKREDTRRQKRAEAMWLSAEEKIAGTPVDHYLRNRGIDLSTIGHQPRALRYHARLHYRFDDPTTGEVIEFQGPAMVACMVNLKGQITAVHRTWLQIGEGGRWGKLRLPHPSIEGAFLDAKKVYGRIDGAAIRLSNGVGPRAGKGAPLAGCPPGTWVYVAEGIETALSARIMQPGARVLAAYSLGNMARLALPDNVSTVVLIADHDTSDQANAALQAAVDAHADHGREVRVWRSEVPGEDLNDTFVRWRLEAQQAELQQIREQQAEEGAA